MHGLAQVVATTLTLDDGFVNLASGNVAVAGQLDAEVSLVVAKIEIAFAAISEYKALSMSEIGILAVCLCQSSENCT